MNNVDLLRLAMQVALSSPDPSTQNGAFLLDRCGRPILSTMACNEFPAGIGYTRDRWERPAKYAYVEHAERGAIYAAARQGIATEGLTLVCGWAACADCARAMICAGIRHLITLGHGETIPRWNMSTHLGMGLLGEAGVRVTIVPGPLGGCEPLRRDGKVIYP